MTATSASRPSPFLTVRPDWLELSQEHVLEPELPIVDCHHHLWDRPESSYQAEDLLSDMAAGHHVKASVFVECRSHYRKEGDRAYRSLGETEYAASVGAHARSALRKPVAGIVAYVDLQAGTFLVEDLLRQHEAAAQGRLSGIRNLSATSQPDRLDVAATERSLLASDSFRDGFSLLQHSRLVFDAWMFHTQLSDLFDLARAFPDTTIVLNHLGGPTGVGPNGANPAGAHALWKSLMTQISPCQNVHVKIGGLGMPHVGFGFHELPVPPSSEALADAWRPLIEHVLHAFGTERCMFESNFPVDKGAFGYVPLWNAYKRLTAQYSREERERLFGQTAARVYRLEEAWAD